jgi:beta-lactamase superfamily II metal-dependent hydrolase
MFRVELIQAGHGDCIWIEYGEPEGPIHRLLIDGGTAGTYKKVKKRIDALPADQRTFDLLVITHIDADHIAGAIKLLADAEVDISFQDTWFNGYQHLTELETLGARQGEVLTDHLEKDGVNWNHAFDGDAAHANPVGGFEPVALPGGMQLTLLSPTRKELSELKSKWKKEAEAAGLNPDRPEEATPDMDTRPSGLEPLGGQLPDIDALSVADSETDSSEANGSSIAFIAEYDNKRILFSGDAHAPVLIESIKAYLGDTPALRLDAFKTPHHGSDANISVDLLKKLDCSRYLVSTNGAYFKHPDDVAIARMIKFGGDAPALYFNYLSRHNKVWSTPVLQADHGYSSHYPAEDDTGIVIDF